MGAAWGAARRRNAAAGRRLANVIRVVYWLFVRLIIDPLSAAVLVVLMLPHIVAVLWQAGNAVRGDK